MILLERFDDNIPIHLDSLAKGILDQQSIWP